MNNYFTNSCLQDGRELRGTVYCSGEKQFEYGTRNEKFPLDKINCEDENYLVQLDGVLLNIKDYFAEYRVTSSKDAVVHLWERYGVSLMRYLKGSYTLILWDKRQKKILITNDWCSNRDLYYYLDHEDGVIYDSSFFDLVSILKAREREIHIDSHAVADMCMKGALNASETYAEEIKFLAPFEYILVDEREKRVSIEKILPNKNALTMSFEEYIDQFDRLFSRAVNLQFRKNQECGYRQVATISGGMDSRSCILKGISQGFREIDCFSYSQSGSIDFEVSQKICIDYKLNFLYYPMDHATFTKYMYEAMGRNECQQSGIGSTGAIACSKLLNLESAGIIHCGLCGGELMSDLITYASKGMDYYFCRFGLKEWEKDKCVFSEPYLMDQFRACQSLTHMFLPYSEVISPFFDEDLVEFVLSIPSQYLIRRKLYREWMIKYLKNSYTTTYFQGSVTISPIKEYIIKIYRRVQKRLREKSKNEMNPLNLWFSTNKELSAAVEKQYANYMIELEKLKISKEILTLIAETFSGDSLKKCYVLTAAYALIVIAE